MRFVLASASPRRQELLTAAGFDFDVEAMNIDERQHEGESALAYVDRLAREKAAAAARDRADRPVLGADTAVVLPADPDAGSPEILLGKPADADDARRMLRALSGRPHEVLTGVALAWRGAVTSRVERTRVWMAEWPEAALEAYIASGEPFDKAGAYAIQGRAARYIPRIDGSYSNVVGLPIHVVHALVQEAGLA